MCRGDSQVPVSDNHSLGDAKGPQRSESLSLCRVINIACLLTDSRIKLIIREAVSHWQLRHENIVTFLGVFYDPSDSASPPSMVLRRAKYSSALKYVEICDDTGSFLKIVCQALPFGVSSSNNDNHTHVDPRHCEWSCILAFESSTRSSWRSSSRALHLCHHYGS